MANSLGRVLRYVADAVVYAGNSFKQINPALRRILWDASRMSGSAIGEEADVDFYLRLAATNPAIYGAITMIADRVKSTEVFQIEQNDGRNEWTEVKQHPFLDVLARPNSIMSGSLLLEDAAWWYKLIGNAYWFLVTDAPGVGQIREIWPLPADRITPDPTTLRISPITHQPVIDYQYSLGSLIKLPGENVIHFRTANPFDPWRGLSPLSALRENMRTSNAITRWLGSFYDKGNAVPASVISLPPLINDDDFETIKQDIYEQFGGKRQTAVTRAGDLKVEVIGQSSTDMQVVEHQKFNKQEVREVYRIPEGLTSATSGQSRLAAETALARDAIQPLLDYFAETFTIFAMRFYDNERRGMLRVKAKSVIPQDRALEVSEYKSYGSDRTINEGRQKQGLQPIKFTGKLAEFQQLVDEVPATLIQTLAPILTGGGAAGGAAGGLGGAMPHPLAQHMAGGLQVRGSQPNAQLPDLQQTGQNSEDSDPGYRVSGLPTAIDPIQEMLGTNKSVLMTLSNPERDAMLYALFNQGAKRADLSVEQPELFNAFLNMLETQATSNR